MLVQKFGGTSLATTENIKRVAHIIKETSKTSKKTVVVLSAMGKVTDDLIDIIDLAQSGDQWQTLLEDLQAKHLQTLNEISSQSEIETSSQKHNITELVQKASSYLQGIALLGQCPNDIYASLITLGEQLSVILMKTQLISMNLSVNIIDAQSSIITCDDTFAGQVDLQATIKRMSTYKDMDTQILLMPGFTSSNHAGKPTTLGRNGSDYSAALAAVSLDAKECQIWTDVDGVFNANPKEVESAYLIPQLSYYEAMELSYFGASVLHPKTITPLMHAQIPCCIKNTFKPQSTGTTISNKSQQSNNVATAISSLQDITMVTVSGPGMKGMVGMASKVFESISKQNISIVLITQSSSEYSISFCIESEQKNNAQKCLEETFALELKNHLLEPIQFKHNLAIISLISDNMKKRRGTAAHFFQSLAIANVNIVAIAQGSNERSISAVVESDRVIRALNSCHQRFFDSTQQVEIILIGCGLVGDAFLHQILKQQNHLKQQNINIKVCGIINSKGALLNENGIDISNYKVQLQSELHEINRNQLKIFRQQNNMINPIIVDCTSSTSVAEAYLDFFSAGYHIIAANKKANTLSLDYYQQLKHTALQYNRQFHYETNVGAGLPVIDTFRNLIRAGDHLNTFEGILSGSMSYIFGKLDEGLSLSKAVIKAKEKGFTEPDPRDDLSGTDIARKVLIIAREAGMTLELSDITIDSLLTDELIDCQSVEEFMSSLASIDDEIALRNEQAKRKGCVLRFVGTIDNSGCSVSIKEIDKSSALYDIKDGENAMAFFSEYYQPIPMVLRGYGAGSAVTAAGVFADVMKILPTKSSFI